MSDSLDDTLTLALPVTVVHDVGDVHVAGAAVFLKNQGGGGGIVGTK